MLPKRGQVRKRPHDPLGSLRISVQQGSHPPVSSLGYRWNEAFWGFPVEPLLRTKFCIIGKSRVLVQECCLHLHIPTLLRGVGEAPEGGATTVLPLLSAFIQWSATFGHPHNLCLWQTIPTIHSPKEHRMDIPEGDIHNRLLSGAGMQINPNSQLCWSVLPEIMMAYGFSKEQTFGAGSVTTLPWGHRSLGFQVCAILLLVFEVFHKHLKEDPKHARVGSRIKAEV